MTDLMRKDLKSAIKNINSAHAGLLMQKGLKEWDTDSEKPTKKALIEKIGGVKADELYKLAFNRWLGLTFDKDEFGHLSATVNGRLFTGLALGGALETGAMVHHTYGMPMIAGSSIKGAVRTYAENALADNSDKQAILDVLFGTESDDGNADAGYLIWHDAWWIPNVKNEQNPFVGEIVTVHHQQYYQGNLSEALDIENPVPNQQIAMTGSFYFTIQGASAWVKYALDLLKGALQYQGLGAKGSNGYGYFDNIDGLEGELKKRYLANKPVDENDPLANIKKEISLLNDEKLQENLSKGITKFFENLGLNKENDDDCKKVIQILINERVNFIDGLKNDGGKNAQKALKFIEKYSG